MRAISAASRSIRARNKAARALEDVLRMFGDETRRRLKVRTALKAGGICIQCGNHSRRVLVVG